MALLWKGCVLSRTSLQALANRGVETLYVHEPGERPTGGRRLLPADLLAAAGQSLNELFQFVAGDGESTDWAPMAAGLDALVRMTVHHFEAHPIRISELTRSGSINPSMAEHSLNVGMVSGLLAMMLGLADRQIRQVVTAGLLHDIGKVFVSPDILYKPGNLSPEELEEITRHPDLGYRILVDRYAVPRKVGLGSLQHHERWDGRGYPCGLRSEEIHSYARIIAVADVFDAMTSKRVYRKSLPAAKVLAYIKQQAGLSFDPAVTSSMERLFRLHAHQQAITTVAVSEGRGLLPEHRRRPVFAPSVRLGQQPVNSSGLSYPGKERVSRENNIN